MAADAGDGLTFANKTADWVAYDRYLESQRPDRLFNDTFSVYFKEPYGKKISDAFAIGGAPMFDQPGVDEPKMGSDCFTNYHAARC